LGDVKGIKTAYTCYIGVSLLTVVFVFHFIRGWSKLKNNEMEVTGGLKQESGKSPSPALDGK